MLPLWAVASGEGAEAMAGMSTVEGLLSLAPALASAIALASLRINDSVNGPPGLAGLLCARASVNGLGPRGAARGFECSRLGDWMGEWLATWLLLIRPTRREKRLAAVAVADTDPATDVFDLGVEGPDAGFNWLGLDAE